MATAEFSKFFGILSEALSQDHLLGLGNSTGIPSPPLALFVIMLPKAHLTRKLEIPREYFMQRWSQKRKEMVGT